MLTLTDPPAAPAIPPEALAAHLRLPVTAPELIAEPGETAILERLIEAATAAIERRIGGALIVQGWRWRVETWRQTLPLHPTIAVQSIEIVDGQGEATPYTDHTLVHGTPQRLVPRSGSPPRIPAGGYAEIRFTAGYGMGWTDVPPDLRQAVTLLAAHWYEHREAAAAPLAPLPLGVAPLIAPYRPIRL